MNLGASVRSQGSILSSCFYSFFIYIYFWPRRIKASVWFSMSLQSFLQLNLLFSWSSFWQLLNHCSTEWKINLSKYYSVSFEPVWIRQVSLFSTNEPKASICRPLSECVWSVFFSLPTVRTHFDRFSHPKRAVFAAIHHDSLLCPVWVPECWRLNIVYTAIFGNLKVMFKSGCCHFCSSNNAEKI